MTKCLFFALLLVSNVAFAQDVPQQTWWQLALNHLIELAVAVLTPSLIMLVHKYTQIIADKAGMHLAETQYALLDDLVTKGVHYAQEQSHKALKDGTLLSAKDKRVSAVKFVTDGVEHLGLTGVATQLVEQYVEAKLSSRRAVAVTPASSEVPA
jgi:hypothetical protein